MAIKIEKNRLTGAVAHRLKEPLSTITIPAELTLRDLAAIREGKKSAAERIPDMENRLRVIIHQTLEAARRIDDIPRFSDPET